MASTSKARKFQLERWLVPVLIIGFCAAAYAVSTTFKTMPPILKRGIQPADFPQLLLICLVLLTGLMIWLDPVQVRDRIQGTVWGTMAMMGLFAALAGIDLFLALGVFAASLAAFWGERRGGMLVLVGLIVPASIFFFFDGVFEIRFPRGLLTNLWYG